MVNKQGRFSVNQPWPQGAFVTKPITQANYGVQQFTGYAYGTVPGTNWDRGQLYRFDTPMFRPPVNGLRMYDPTDINTYSVKRG